MGVIKRLFIALGDPITERTTGPLSKGIRGAKRAAVKYVIISRIASYPQKYKDAVHRQRVVEHTRPKDVAPTCILEYDNISSIVLFAQVVLQRA